MLLFMDGMAHYSTAEIDEKWTSVDVGAGVSTAWAVTAEGRFGNCIKRTSLNATAGGNLVISPLISQSGAWSPKVSGVFGCALKVDDLSALKVPSQSGDKTFLLTNASINSLGLDLSPSGTFALWRQDLSPVLLGTSVEAIINDTWAFIEFKWVIDGAVGSFEIRSNGVPVLTLTGIDTLPNKVGADVWNSLNVLGGPSPSGDAVMRICDVHLFDLTGTVNNDFIGDAVVDVILPDGVGNSSGWAPTPGPNNWADADEVPPDGDTSYVEATTAALKDTYTFQDVLGDPFGIQICAYARRTAVGSATLKPIVRQGTTDYAGVELGIGDTAYSYLLWPYDTNPDTGLRFTKAEMDAAEFGPQKET